MIFRFYDANVSHQLDPTHLRSLSNLLIYVQHCENKIKGSLRWLLFMILLFCGSRCHVLQA